MNAPRICATRKKRCGKRSRHEKRQWQDSNSRKVNEVTEEEIAEIVSSWTGMPVQSLPKRKANACCNMEDVLHKRVIGQNEAVAAVSKAIRRGRVGLKDPKRPIGSFIFLGPTGVGKTELSKALAEALFGTKTQLSALICPEYMEKYSFHAW